MKKQFVKRLLAIGLTGSMMLSSFVMGGQTAQAKATATKNGWNFNIYMCGSNLESQWGCASADILEIMKAGAVPGNVHVVIETGGSREWKYKDTVEAYYRDELKMSEETIKAIDTQNISNEYIQRYEIKFDNEITQEGTKITYPSLVLLSENEGLNSEEKADDLREESVGMGDKEVLADFVKEVDSDYNHNALVFWNHGGGTEGGVCNDENQGMDSLSLLEIKDALSEVKDTIPNGQFDMIGYDACLMSSFETLAMTSHFAKYCAASMTLEAGDGWYYTPVFEALKNHASDANFTGADLSKAVADAYNEYYLTEEAKKNGTADPDAFMGAYDLSKLSALTLQFDEMAHSMLKISCDKNLFEGFLNAAYRAVEVDTITDLISMSSFFDKTIAYAEKYIKKNAQDGDMLAGRSIKTCQEYIENATALKQSMFDEAFILKQIKGGKGSVYYNDGGISFYFPCRDSFDFGNYVNTDYESLNISRFYQIFANNVANDVMAWQAKPVTTSLKYNKKAGTYSFQLTSDSIGRIQALAEYAYMNVGDMQTVVNAIDFEIDNDVHTAKPITEYSTFGKTPILLLGPESTGEEGVYAMVAGFNGEWNHLYMEKKNGSFYALSDYEFAAGDVITPYVYAKYGWEPYEKGNYTIKKSDIKADGSVKLPVAQVKDTKGKLKIGFVAEDLMGGSVYKTFYHKNIVKFANATAKLNKKTFKATGLAIRPKVTVKSGKTTLKKGTDYKLVYKNNIAAGKATVTVVGIGKYECAPKKTLTYTITVNKKLEAKKN